MALRMIIINSNVFMDSNLESQKDGRLSKVKANSEK